MPRNTPVSTQQTNASAACGARRPGWEYGPAIGIHRIPCVLPVHGPDVPHRNAFGLAWTEEGTK
ncbi:hypothetical protein SAMN05442782_7098 [Streptomyces sp. OK228]|nr:hypothetical protein SAMN05442782_7098 [Streptomyces sp. OK228]